MNTYKFRLRNKDKIWYLNNDWHRGYDRPSWIWADGDKSWWQHGKCHRDNDKPAIIWSDGSLGYWVNGEKIK